MQDKVLEITHTDEEWRRLLSPEQYRIMRDRIMRDRIVRAHGTEAPGSYALNHEKR
jgi:peptide-methionine (R)-S-oxide reductase